MCIELNVHTHLNSLLLLYTQLNSIQFNKIAIAIANEENVRTRENNAEGTLLAYYGVRSETSCRSSPFWRCRTPRGSGWPAGADPRAHPANQSHRDRGTRRAEDQLQLQTRGSEFRQRERAARGANQIGNSVKRAEPPVEQRAPFPFSCRAAPCRAVHLVSQSHMQHSLSLSLALRPSAALPSTITTY